MDLAIIVVNYRTPKHTIACLRSLAPEVAALPDSRVIVVENGSGDGSAEKIAAHIQEQRFADWVTLLTAPTNRGYGAGCNMGLRAAPEARYVLFLNNDVVVHRGSLRTCLQIMEEDSGIGLLSCLILDEEGSAQTTGLRFPTPSRELARAFGLPWHFPNLFGWADLEDLSWDRRSTARDVDWLVGAFLMARRSVLDQVGSFDEDFFLYGDDVELCHRVSRAGFRCHYSPRASATHTGAASTGPDLLPRRDQLAHIWRSRYLVQCKCYGKLAAAALRLAELGTGSARVLWYLLRGRSGEPRFREVVSRVAIIGRGS